MVTNKMDKTIMKIPGHALHEKGLQRQKASVHWSAARKKERFSSR